MEPGIKSNNVRKSSEKSSQQSAAKTQTQTKTNSRQLAKPVHTSTQVPLNDPPEVNVTVSRSLKNLQNNFKEMRDNQQGLNENLKYVGEQAECNYDDISTLKTENINLRRELELLRSVVIRMDRRMSIMDNEITDLRSRSMRDNILIHNFKYTPNEDLAATMPALIKQTLGVDVSFVRIHRNGVLHKKSDRPVSITAKLTDRNKKDEILNAQKSKKIARVSLPFYITPQQPPSLVSARNKLFDKSDSLKKQNISVKISRNSIVLPNGSKYIEEVPLLSNAAVLKIDQTESEQLDDIVTMNTEPIQKNGSEFYATGTKVGSVNQAQNFYKKVCIDPYVASVDSRILIYRFMEQGKLIENYHDDGEHGAGRRLLKYMRENQIMDVAIVVTRWMGEHIGPQRFTIMEGLVNEVANLILDCEHEDDSTRHTAKVDQALLIVRSALANQIDWTEIESLVREAQLQGDPVASCITGLKLDSNMITLLLRDPYRYSDDEYDDDDDDDVLKPTKVDIDISMSAYGNSRKYFDKKKTAAKKEQKTIDASAKALKSAERKTKETLKDVATAATINKARKTYWFEKFLWFITSENYLVIGGRDQQQNEMIVKRYLRPGDLYVHADLHGASSCVLKNPSGEPVPPKSLNEAGTMAICNSVAWDAKVVTSAWWVYHDQVSKTAPSGEYLTTGSFMIRGKKNYLPPTHLVYGFGLLFKLEDDSIERHKGERKVHGVDDDTMSVTDSIATESDLTADTNSVTIDTDSDNDSENDSKSENNEDNERLQESDSENNKSESKNDSGDGVQGIKAERTEESDKEEVSFPDTSISLQHVKGDKFELQRERSSTSGSVEEPQIKETTEEQDGKTGGRGAKLSAKQRREMKKAKKSQNQQTDSNADEEDRVSWLHQDKDRPPVKDSRENQSKQKPKEEDPDDEESVDKQPQIQLKRGQRNKLKKIKEKYGDQDEEERQLRMEILASAGSKKEEKKKKGKKGQSQGQQKSGRPVSGKKQLQQQRGTGQAKSVELILKPTAEIIIDDADIEEKEKIPVVTVKQEAQNDSDDEKQEEDLKPDDVMMLDSLTGCPVAEDELLYAIPVCAPYSTMLNYKFKVKLMPGSTKRGKAAKLALNMFAHEKSTTPRERDLVRILKDADTSRNIPGKVKVSAPNLHKAKGK